MRVAATASAHTHALCLMLMSPSSTRRSRMDPPSTSRYGAERRPLLVQDVDPHQGHTVLHHVERVRGPAAQVENAAGNVRSPIVDPHANGTAVLEIRHADPRPKREG